MFTTIHRLWGSVSQYVHHTPGRLRVRSAGLKRNQSAADKVRAAFKDLPGVNKVEVNTITGSVTLIYDLGLIDADTLKAHLRAHGHLHTSPQRRAAIAAPRGTPAVSGIGAGERVARTVATMLLEKLVEHSALALVAAII